MSRRVVCIDDSFAWRHGAPADPEAYARPVKGRVYTVTGEHALELFEVCMLELAEIPHVAFDARGFVEAGEREAVRLAAIAAEPNAFFFPEPEGRRL